MHVEFNGLHYYSKVLNTIYSRYTLYDLHSFLSSKIHIIHIAKWSISPEIIKQVHFDESFEGGGLHI